MPIDATKGLSSGVSQEHRAWRQRAADLRQARRASGFSSKPTIWPVVVEPEDAHLRRVGRAHRLRRQRDVGVALGVRLDELGVVHPVQVVAGQDQVVLGVERLEVTARLAHGVGGALEPAVVVGRLLGRDDVDEPLREPVEPVGLADVAVERGRVELRQDVDAPDLGVAGSC